MISEEQATAHVQAGGMQCPVCGSDQIEGGFVETGEGRASQEIRCLACHECWTDIYRLNSILIEQ